MLFKDIFVQAFNFLDLNKSPYNITYASLPEYADQTTRFLQVYQLVSVILPAESNRPSLKPKRERVCRFCNQSYPATTFQKDAHLIPELLGNKNLYSDFECDNCNKFFDTNYENDLSNFLGISRTLGGVKGKNGIPGFKTPDKSIKAKVAKNLSNETLVVTREDTTNGAITMDKETGRLTMRIKRNPFVPVNVYKIMLKMALSILDETTVRTEYETALNFLMSRLKDKEFTGCLMSGYSLQATVSFPLHMFLFKKRNRDEKIHTHVFVLYFSNWIFSLPVPLNKHDIHFYNQELTLPVFPPMFPVDICTDKIQVSSFEEDFTSAEKITHMEDIIVIQPNPEDLAKVAVFNTDTNEVTEGVFNPGEIVQIVIQQNTGPVNKEELSKFLREQ